MYQCVRINNELGDIEGLEKCMLLEAGTRVFRRATPNTYSTGAGVA